MNKPKNIVTIGQVFGRLTVIGEAPSKNNARYVSCRCLCGTIRTFSISNLVHGKSKSCGCLPNKRALKHGLAWYPNGKMRPLYHVWLNMKSRCNNKNNKSYHIYGGRGIEVCSKWLNNYFIFHNWAISSGYKKGLTIERKDNDGNYEPDNCKWATRKEQANNRRTNYILNYNGIKYTLSKLTEQEGFNYGTLFCRLKRGWSVEDAINRPLDNRGGRYD